MMGPLTETGIFSQWFHTNELLHYARWKGGEVDIVYLDPRRQGPLWAVEVKWSDRFVARPQELKSVIQFCRSSGLDEAIITSRTLSETRTVEGIRLVFIPASLYCYTVAKHFF